MGQGRRSCTAQMCFRSISVSRPSGGAADGLLSANNGLMQCSKNLSLDHLVGNREQRRGYVEAAAVTDVDPTVRPSAA
jgi:hypothetical protein